MSGRLPALFDPASMYGQLSAGFFPEDNLRGFFLRRREQALAGRPQAPPSSLGLAAALAVAGGLGAVCGDSPPAPRPFQERTPLETVFSFLVSPAWIAAGGQVGAFQRIERRQHEDQLTIWLEDLPESVTQCRLFLLNRRLLDLFQPDFPGLFGEGGELSAEQLQSILQRALDSRTLRENRSVAQKLARRAVLDIRCFQGRGRQTWSIPPESPLLEADTWAVVAMHQAR